MRPMWQALRSRRFVLIWVGQLIAQTGDWFTYVAVCTRLYDMGYGATAISGFLISQMAAYLVLGQFAGVLVDRFDRRRTMIATDFLRAACIAGVIFCRPLWAIYLLVFIAGIGSTLFRPALQASVPNLVEPEAVNGANSLVATAYNFGFVFGPSLGGLATALFGGTWTIAINSVTFLASAALISATSVPRAERPAARLDARAAFTDIREGLAFLRRHPDVLVACISLFFILAVCGMVNVIEVYFAREVLLTDERGFGFMLTAWGAGMMVGALGTGLFRLDKGAMAYMLALVAVEGIGVGLTGFARSLPFALVMLFLGGLGNGAMNVAGATIIQQGTPDRLRGRVFATRFMLAYSAWAASLAVAGYLPALFSLRALYWFAGLWHAGVVLLSVWILAAGRRKAPGEATGEAPSAASSAG